MVVSSFRLSSSKLDFRFLVVFGVTTTLISFRDCGKLFSILSWPRLVFVGVVLITVLTGSVVGDCNRSLALTKFPDRWSTLFRRSLDILCRLLEPRPADFGVTIAAAAACGDLIDSFPLGDIEVSTQISAGLLTFFSESFRPLTIFVVLDCCCCCCCLTLVVAIFADEDPVEFFRVLLLVAACMLEELELLLSESLFEESSEVPEAEDFDPLLRKGNSLALSRLFESSLLIDFDLADEFCGAMVAGGGCVSSSLSDEDELLE